MRNFLKALLAVALVAPTFAFAANLVTSKHNLTATNLFATARTNWDEMCVFCHTPHNSAGQTKLLWNRTVPTNVGWAAGNTTTAGTQLPLAGQVQGVSAMCLSCHDGATAIGAVTNASNRLGAITYTGTNISATGQITAVLTRLGTNLQGAHPVSVPYPRTGKPGYASIAVSGADPLTYAAPLTVGCLGSAQCAGNNVNIPLFTDTSGRMGIECGSCHDAHDNVNGSFLRISNAGSALCLACHLK